MEEKKQFVSELEDYLNSTRSIFSTFAENLGWNVDELMKVDQEPIVSCPFDSGHRMPISSLDKHVETCSWIHDGYTKEEKEKALPSSHFFYTNSTSVVPVLIDKDTQTKILQNASGYGFEQTASKVEKEVPRTMERAIVDLSPPERLAIYEYVIAKAKETNKQHSIQLEDLYVNFEKKNVSDEKKEKSRLEMLAEQRDYKRRRQSYRAKNVHITKKSYTEIMRGVIHNQMDFLQHMLGADEPNESHSDKEGSNVTNSSKTVQTNSPNLPETKADHHRVSSNKYEHAEQKEHRHSNSSRKRRKRNEDESSSREKHRHRHKHKHHKHKKSRKHVSSSDEDSRD